MKRGQEATPVAIVGIGCRLPGNANSAKDFWQLLLAERDTVGDVPSSRFDVGQFYNDNPGTPGHISTRLGSFLETMDTFDASFFGISPREAERMDPQQRLLLEVAWEAFEDANVPPDRAAKDECIGVFVGVMETGYEALLFQDLNSLDVLGLNGSGLYATAGRISYCLNLSGPSMSIDTACSSSLVAVHQACQSIHNGESTMALAGGAHLILQPHVSICFSQGGMLAPDGRCKFGDESANGFGRGEGVGLVLLERLDSALENGRKIYAVIRGGAVGSYGFTDGAMPRPSVDAQARNVHRAYEAAGVRPSAVQYVEAHGTGTRAGDGVELRALGMALGAGRHSPEDFLRVGSVKTNLAHAEAASGIAGLIKLALSLHHKYLPRSLHFKTPNPTIPWSELPVRVQSQAGEWPAPLHGECRIAGINNFGISGTNAHLVLQEAPQVLQEAPKVTDDVTLRHEVGERPEILALSAKSPEALVDLGRAYEQRFTSAGDGDVDRTPGATDTSAVVRAAALGRMHHELRAAIVARTRAEFVDALKALATHTAHPKLKTGRRSLAKEPKVAFVFSGHGSQWLGMGRSLLETEPVFRASIEASDKALRKYTDWSLLKQLLAAPEESRLSENDVVQPVLFGVAVALAALWQSWGITPSAVVGHSMGEIAAAHVAGALTLDDAARVVCLRSQVLGRITGRGRMVMVELSAEEAQRRLRGSENDIWVAVIQNSRFSVLSGAPAALERFVDVLEREGVFCRWVKVNYASHCPHVEEIKDELAERLAPVRPKAGTFPIYSTLQAKRIDGSQCDANYWFENLRNPVRFSAAIEQLALDGHDVFLEMSPHPLLLTSIAVPDGLFVGSLRRDEDERTSLLESLAALYTFGCNTAFAEVCRRGTTRESFTDLPSYPFQRKRYWSSRTSRVQRVGHPLIGAPIVSSLDTNVQLFQTELGVDDLPYLKDHTVEHVVVFPAAGYVEMALAAASANGVNGIVALEAVQFLEPLVLESTPCTVQLALTTAPNQTFRAQISSRIGDGPWLCHAKLTLRASNEVGHSTALQPDAIKARLSASLSKDAFYRSLADRDLSYGELFQGVTDIGFDSNQALAQIQPSNIVTRDGGYWVHPAILDACLHPLLALIPERQSGPFVPQRIAQITVHGRPIQPCWSHARLEHTDANQLRGHVDVYDAHGRLLVEISDLVLTRLERRILSREVLFTHEAVPYSLPSPKGQREPGAVWLIVPDATQEGSKLARRLQQLGHAAVVCEELSPRNEPSFEDHKHSLAGHLPPGASCAGVVYLTDSTNRGLDNASVENEKQASALVSEEAEYQSALTEPVRLLHLVQALTAHELSAPPRLYLITRGAQHVTLEKPHAPTRFAAAGACIIGFGRVLAHEHPEFAVTCVDRAVDPSHDEVETLATLMLGNGPSGEFELRSDRVHSLQLASAAVPSRRSSTPLVRTDRTYLITGGLGGLGLTLARFLIARGAKYLCLIGRTKHSQILEELSQQATVRFEQVDVSNREQLAAALARLDAPLAGVFHAAGSLNDGLVESQTSARFASVMAPKAKGAWNLHDLTRATPLDHFMLYSSASAVVGTPGQTNYAAANAFLDELACYRRSLGLPALSVNWGLFSEVGLAAQQENRGQRLMSQGFDSLTPDEGTQMLAELLQTVTPPHISVMRFEAREWVKSHPQIAQSTYFASLIQDTGAGQVANEAPILQQLEQLRSDSTAHLSALQTFVAQQAAHVLKLDPATLDPNAHLRSAGFDSLMGLELRNRLESALRLRLPATLLWAHPTVASLGTHLHTQLSSAAEPQKPSAPPPQHTANSREHDDSDFARRLPLLSRDEKEELLEQTLQQLADDV